MLTDGAGIPLAVVISAANRHDMQQLDALLDALPLPMPPTAPGAARHLCLDRGYDYAACRDAATARGDTPHIPPKATDAQPLPPPGHPDRHPPRRWVVEVTHSWFNRFRRLLIRWDKQTANHLGFVQLAAVLISYRKVRHARTSPG